MPTELGFTHLDTTLEGAEVNARAEVTTRPAGGGGEWVDVVLTFTEHKWVEGAGGVVDGTPVRTVTLRLSATDAVVLLPRLMSQAQDQLSEVGIEMAARV